MKRMKSNCIEYLLHFWNRIPLGGQSGLGQARDATQGFKEHHFQTLDFLCLLFPDTPSPSDQCPQE